MAFGSEAKFLTLGMYNCAVVIGQLRFKGVFCGTQTDNQ